VRAAQLQLMPYHLKRWDVMSGMQLQDEQQLHLLLSTYL
jgi:hypothetical protein